jgi:rhomboid protease GluP
MRFSQKQVEQLPLDNLTTEQFLSLAIETSNLLGWVFGNISETGFIAYTNNGLFSWNAEVKLKINNGLANLQSESRGDDIVDLRENKKNLQSFTTTFKGLEKTLTPEELASIYENLKPNFV